MTYTTCHYADADADFGRLTSSLIAIIGGKGEEFHAWGCTNYMDSRIILTINYLQKKRRLTMNNMKQIAIVYEDFLSCMVCEDGTYIVCGGQYELILPKEKVRRFFKQVEIEISSPKLLWIVLSAAIGISSVLLVKYIQVLLYPDFPHKLFVFVFGS